MMLKSTLSTALLPLARLWRGLAAARRLWAHAGLRAACRHRLDSSVVVLACPEVHGSGDIRLGAGLLLYPGLYLETRGGGHIAIGDGAVLSRGVHIVAYDAVHIGAGSMIGEYSSVRDANHGHGGGLAPRGAGHTARAIHIGRNVWIGRGVTVLAGVHIGDGAVVGANAVVTADVAAAAVVGGVPARPLERRRPA
jgi:acetyltransferase-like isoleucine patch superfamily enzyme